MDTTFRLVDPLKVYIRVYFFMISEGALRLPATYDNHPSNPIPSHPIHPFIYSCQGDLSIENLI